MTDKRAKEKIEAAMGDLVDLLAANPQTEVGERAWRQLLIYAPATKSASA